jgi:hypothetical protein
MESLRSISRWGARWDLGWSGGSVVLDAVSELAWMLLTRTEDTAGLSQEQRRKAARPLRPYQGDLTSDRLQPTTSDQIQHHADDEHHDEDAATAARPIVRIAIVAAAEPSEQEEQNDNNNE